jgi:phenylpropionate dioxygenase-like ring-hydroxylating dioxygenase large terminal subunit
VRIDKRRYTSNEFFELERERLWPRVWLLAARASDVPERGTYATFELLHESILLTNDGSEIRAFHNVCRHRGHRLRPCGKGKATALNCTYHGWTYRLDGRLTHVLDEHTFAGGVPREERSLVPLACSVHAGFVWVAFDRDAPPLRDYLGPMAEALERYDLVQWVVSQSVTIRLEANWKTCVDAWNEPYHVHSTHPQLLPALDDVHVHYEPMGRHYLQATQLGVVSPRLPTPTTLNPFLEALMKDAGIDPASFEGTPADVRVAMQRARRTSRPDVYARLSDAQLTDVYSYFVFPNLCFVMWADTGVVYRYMPHADDPNRGSIDFLNVTRDRNAAVSPHAEQARHDPTIPEVLAQDLDVIENAQRGMRSRGFTELFLSESEIRVAHLHAGIDEVMALDSPGSSTAAVGQDRSDLG